MDCWSYLSSGFLYLKDQKITISCRLFKIVTSFVQLFASVRFLAVFFPFLFLTSFFEYFHFRNITYFFVLFFFSFFSFQIP